MDDRLYFYYTAFQGNESNLNPLQYWSGLYSNASTGLAILRCDGFASMESEEEEESIILTRIVTFSGKHLFVNMDSPRGRLYAEICQPDGKPVPGFTRNECLPISTDSTKYQVKWKGKESMESLAEIPVRFKFYLTNSKIYAFWVSQHNQGSTGGGTAAGGHGLNGTWDI